MKGVVEYPDVNNVSLEAVKTTNFITAEIFLNLAKRISENLDDRKTITAEDIEDEAYEYLDECKIRTDNQGEPNCGIAKSSTVKFFKKMMSDATGFRDKFRVTKDAEDRIITFAVNVIYTLGRRGHQYASDAGKKTVQELHVKQAHYDILLLNYGY